MSITTSITSIISNICISIIIIIRVIMILDIWGLDSSIILISRGGILMSMDNFPEMLSQAILVGIILAQQAAEHKHRTVPTQVPWAIENIL